MLSGRKAATTDLIQACVPQKAVHGIKCVYVRLCHSLMRLPCSENKLHQLIQSSSCLILGWYVCLVPNPPPCDDQRGILFSLKHPLLHHVHPEHLQTPGRIMARHKKIAQKLPSYSSNSWKYLQQPHQLLHAKEENANNQPSKTMSGKFGPPQSRRRDAGTCAGQHQLGRLPANDCYFEGM